MASFGLITFKFLVQGHTYGTAATINVESLPEGSVIVIDIGGVGEERLSGTCQFTTFADFIAMINLAKIGAEDVLTYSEQTRTAVLASISRNQVTPNGGSLARCEWILE